MKRILFSIAMMTFLMLDLGYVNHCIAEVHSLSEPSVFKRYQCKYIEGNNEEVYATSFTLNVTKTRIEHYKGGETKYWNVKDMGDVYHSDSGASFKFRKLYLPTPKKYVYISYDKMIKFKGVFYYMIIMDGVTQYVL